MTTSLVIMLFCFFVCETAFCINCFKNYLETTHIYVCIFETTISMPPVELHDASRLSERNVYLS